MHEGILALFLAIFCIFDGTHGHYQCHTANLASMTNVDESKLSREWYLQAIHPAPSSPRSGYQDYSYSIEPSPGGLIVKADGIKRGEKKCLRQEVEMWKRKPGHSAIYTYRRGYGTAESVILYTDYKHLLVELVCINPRGGACQESEVAVYTRMRVGDEIDVRQGLDLVPGQCVTDASRLVRIPQDISTFPCQRKLNRQCDFESIPIEQRPEMISSPEPIIGLWYVVRNYPSSYRERTFFGNYLLFNCSIVGLDTEKVDWSCPYKYRPPGQEKCIQGDFEATYRYDKLSQYDFFENTVNINVRVKVAYFDKKNFVAFTCYKFKGRICENYSIRLFTKTPKASPDAIRAVENLVKSGGLCTDPNFYYEAPNNEECTNVEYVGNNAKDYLDNLREARKPRKKSPGTNYSSLMQQRRLVLEAKTYKLEAERDMLLASKEKIALEIELIKKHMRVYG